MNNLREDIKQGTSGFGRLIQASLGTERLQRNYWDASAPPGTARVTEQRRGGIGQVLLPASYRVAAGGDNVIRGRGMRTDARRMALLWDLGRDAGLIAGTAVGIASGEPVGTVFACTTGLLLGTNLVANTAVKVVQHLR